ncbi:MAG: S41 family peptidase [Bacteroidota bacterium]|nr:S41 family peptidase [Bacteroidota bacterium]
MRNTAAILLILIFFAGPALSQTPLWLRDSKISPNGQTVAFTYKGDIYTVAAKGGEAKPLTRDKATDYAPVWSPDGKTLAFASARNGSFDIYTVSAQGGQFQRLTYYSGNEIPSDFSPDGKKILFSSLIQDPASHAGFPTRYLTELYTVPTQGGRIVQVIATPAQQAKFLNDGKRIIYQNVKSPENYWRKHQQSSASKDILLFDSQKGTHEFIIKRAGEDRLPVLSQDEKVLYFTSERSDSSMNVYKMDFSSKDSIEQLTHFKTHPVRHLSVSETGILCFSYHGELYTMQEGSKPQKLKIIIRNDFDDQVTHYTKSSGAKEIAVSPDGKEIAFILRGNVFVTAVDYSTTKQITDSPEQERSVSFSPGGDSILYASERKGSWKIFQTVKKNAEEKNFSNSTLLKEELLVGNSDDCFQPSYSPDGKYIAYLSERTELKTLNLKTKKTRTVLPGKYNYSYSDGDQYYQWSPDGKYFLVSYSPNSMFSNDVGLVKADGSEEPFNMTLSGYSDANPKWIMNGKGMIWSSDRNGYRSHGSWGSQRDIYAMLFTEEAFNKLNASKEEYELKYKEEKKKDDKKDDEKKKKEKPKVKIDKSNLQDRIIRLTSNSSFMADALMSADGKKLYYFAKFEKGYDLWVKKIYEKETKLLLKLGSAISDMDTDKKGEFVFILSKGKIVKISTKDNSKKPVAFKAEYEINNYAERSYLFEHMHRQMKKKFYVKDMHGVDWDFYKKEYQKFLPHINSNRAYAEMMSELLGELNASHTGAYARSDSGGDKTAALGIFYNIDEAKDGLTIKDIIEKSPADRVEPELENGDIILEIDGNKISANHDFYRFLNHKAGKSVVWKIKRKKTGKTENITLKPTSIGAENNLLYNRWVEKRRKQTEELSGGKIGYVHIKGMNSSSFRKVYSELLGQNYHKQAVVVDSRYNGGGWLHDDLATLLSGQKYIDFVPRGQTFGYDPMGKWIKPSIVLMSEGNYSDAHAFPFVYKTLGIGKLVGMPVPGTMTAVWWENQINPKLVFGIPEIGTRTTNGNLLENKQLEPDIKVLNEYSKLKKGHDQQLKTAIEHLLKEK